MKGKMETGFRQIEKYNPARYLCLLLVILALIANGAKLCLAIIYDFVLERIDIVDGKQLILLGISSLVTIIIISAVNWVKRVLGEEHRQKRIAQVQGKVISELENKRLDRIEKVSEGEWTTLLSDDVEQCSNYFFKFTLAFLTGIILFIASVCVGVYLSVKLTLIIIVCSLFAFLIPKFFISGINKTYDSKIHNKEKLQERLIQPLHFKNLIKAYDYEIECEKNIESAYINYANECVEEAKLSAAMTGISIGSAFTISSLWMVIGIFFMVNNSISVGDFAAFMMLSDYFNWPFTEVGGLLAERTKIKVSLERLEKYLLLEKDDCEMEKSTEGDAIYFTNAELLLENSGKLIIKKNVISMNGKDRIAIVGGSGKGKTTLCKLIMGGYYPSKGEISICLDGKKYSKGMLRSVIGYMPQKSNIFSGTIKENIAVGKEGATEEEIKEVARIACVDSFVKEFPEGYKTVVGNNAKYQLSGGQIARIALARTLLRSVPIYILDEFSAALDNETELKILNNLEEIDAIIIHVTHKEQTKGFCNKIVNIDNFVNLCTGGCRTK